MRRLGHGLLVVSLAAGTGAVFLRVVSPAQELPGLALLAAFIPFGMGAWLLAVALAAGLHRRWVALAAVAGLAVQISWIAPYYRADAGGSTGQPVHLAAINILGGASDVTELTAQVRTADIVILTEYESVTAAEVARAGWASRFPYTVGAAGTDGVSGSIIFSRFPIRQLAQLPTRFRSYAVEVTPAGAQPFVLLAVHPLNPLYGTDVWRAEAEVIAHSAASFAGRPLVLAGDLNSTPDHVTVRAILRRGALRSAADAAGAGWLRTYPDNSLLPRLIPLDQILIGGGVRATKVETFPAPRSDHAGIRAELLIPTD